MRATRQNLNWNTEADTNIAPGGLYANEVRRQRSQAIFPLLPFTLSPLLPCLLVLWLATVAAMAAAPVLTNVTVANITPSGFTVVWKGAAGGTSDVQVFADESGTINLAGQLAIEPYPLHTGNPATANSYERRLSQTHLRTKTSGYGSRAVRVGGCRPDTTYYYQLISVAPGGSTNLTPASAPFPSVHTAKFNSFVPDLVEVLMDVQGLDVEGRIVTLTHSNAVSALAAVVGDGAGTNQVWFNLSELMALAGNGNFTPTGDLEFLAQVLGSGPDGGRALEFTVTFSNAFSVARSVLSTIGSELVALSVGSAVMRAGTTSSVPITVDSTVTLGNISATLEIPSGHLSNFVLEAVAPEVDPAGLLINPISATRIECVIPARAAQSLFANHELARLRFLAVGNVPSAFVPIRPVSVTATKLDLDPANVAIYRPGRVVVVANEPLLEANAGPPEARFVTLFGKPWSTYAILWAPSVTGPWQTVKRVATTNLSRLVLVPPVGQARSFYRALESETNPPELQVARSPSGSVDLVVLGQTGSQYTVQTATNLSPPIIWRSYQTLSLTTNSFRYLSSIPTTNSTAFFRVSKP
jgi:hypothetical protein